jgi:hypothetical protein
MTEDLKKEIIDLLDNVTYWETCPKSYKTRIEAVKKALTIHVVIASNCKHCDNKLCDAQRFNNVCFKCGKKPI